MLFASFPQNDYIIVTNQSKQTNKIMFEPELKLYSEIKEVFRQQSIEILNCITTYDEFADDWVYRHRWELFDMPIDDELIFEYHHVEDLQDMAYRYLEHKLSEA